jgi:hypothetical protein
MICLSNTRMLRHRVLLASSCYVPSTAITKKRLLLKSGAMYRGKNISTFCEEPTDSVFQGNLTAYRQNKLKSQMLYVPKTVQCSR